MRIIVPKVDLRGDSGSLSVDVQTLPRCVWT